MTCVFCDLPRGRLLPWHKNKFVRLSVQAFTKVQYLHEALVAVVLLQLTNCELGSLRIESGAQQELLNWSATASTSFNPKPSDAADYRQSVKAVGGMSSSCSSMSQ
jgi:hypothetical protein